MKVNQDPCHAFPLLSLAGRGHLRNQPHRLIAAAATFNNWPSLAAIAEEQGMAPLFYAHCRTAGIDMPVDVRRQLQALTVRHQFANEIHVKALGEIVQACNTEGIENIVLGEAALAKTVYSTAGMRPIYSLELLTLPSATKTVERILHGLNYHHSQLSSGLPGGSWSGKVFLKKQAGLRIMLQIRQSLGDPSVSTLAVDPLVPFKNSIAFKLEGTPARCLSPEEMLRHAYRKMISTDIRIIHISDLISTAELFVAEIDWQSLRKNYPGMIATLALLDGVMGMETQLIRAAKLPITPSSGETDDGISCRLKVFMLEAMADSSRLLEWGRLLAGKLLGPEAVEHLLTMQHRSSAVWPFSGKDPGLLAVLDSKSAIIQQAGLVPMITASGNIPLHGNTAATSGKSIPRIIHQTWKDATIPEDLAHYRQSWKQHHPDWTFILWTDHANRELIRRCYAWFLPFYDGYPESIMRADAARYFILHHFGGLYVDLDFEAFRSLDPLLAGKEVVFGLEPPEHLLLPLATERHLARIVGNAFMASMPEHPLWSRIFQKLIECSHEPGPLDATGPFLLTGACASYEEPGRISLVPDNLLYPIDNTVIFNEMEHVRQKRIQDEAYAVHHWRGGWWRNKPRQETDIIGDVRAGGQSVSRFCTPIEQYCAWIRSRPDHPLVSAMMVTKNRPHLAERSVRCFLDQTYQAKELVIFDDGDDGRLEKFVRGLNDPRVRFFRIRPEGKKLGDLRNLAVAEARGEFVAQWDDDDLSDPQRLEIQMSAILILQLDACLLQRHMIWYPLMQRLAISNVRQWESSFVCRKSIVPAYPSLSKGEDTPVIDQICRGRYLWLDYPQLYIYTFHGRNTFDGNHFDELWRVASRSFEKEAYWTHIAELSRRLGINLAQADHGLLEERLDGSGTTAVAQGMPGGAGFILAPRRTIAANILILIPVKDATRHLPGCLRNLRGLTFPHARISLGFIEGDSRDKTWSWLEEAMPSLQREFRRVTLVKRDFGYRLEGNRWEIGKQRRRREILARSRNYLLSRALDDEDWVLWLDVDVARFPADVIEKMLAYGKEIAVPNCLALNGDQQYDLNTYKLKAEAVEIDWRLHIIDDLLQPPAGLGRWYLNDLILFDAVEVDAVGGTMLLIKADLHREGLIFPPFPYRHTIETEGLAAMARDMGFRCWGLPKVVIHHPP